MTKLTTERLEKLQDDLLQFQDHYSDPADKENYDIFVDALHVIDEFKAAKEKLLAYEQAAKNPIAWVVGDEEIADFKNGREVCVMRDCDDEQLDYLPLYAAPVLPKQPELVVLTDEQIDAVLDSKANMAYIISDKRERLRMFAREIIRTAMISTAPAQPVSEFYKLNGWISVDNELPEEGAHVLVFNDGAFVLLAEFTGGEFYDVARDGEEFFETVTRCVTHWMPLPAAPKASE